MSKNNLECIVESIIGFKNQKCDFSKFMGIGVLHSKSETDAQTDRTEGETEGETENLEYWWIHKNRPDHIVSLIPNVLFHNSFEFCLSCFDRFTNCH